MALAQTLDELQAFARAGSFHALRVPRLVALTLPQRVTAGDNLLIEWRTQNCTSVLVRVSGPEPTVRRLQANGRLELPTEVAGDWRFALELRGDSDIAQVPPRAVQVICAPLAMRLSHTLIKGECGLATFVRWASEGAAETHVTRGGIKLDLPASGKLEVEMGLAREQLVFEACAADGRCTRNVIDMVPVSNAILPSSGFEAHSIESEIALINQHLEILQ